MKQTESRTSCTCQGVSSFVGQISHSFQERFPGLMSIQVPFSLWVSTVLSKTWKWQKLCYTNHKETCFCFISINHLGYTHQLGPFQGQCQRLPPYGRWMHEWSWSLDVQYSRSHPPAAQCQPVQWSYTSHLRGYNVSVLSGQSWEFQMRYAKEKSMFNCHVHKMVFVVNCSDVRGAQRSVWDKRKEENKQHIHKQVVKHSIFSFL